MARPASLVMAIVWLGVIGVGMGALVRYEKTPAAAALHPVDWPQESRFTRDPDGPTLLMFAHPRCPCTRASLEELTRLIDDHNARATVVFYQPEDDDSAEWTETALVQAVHDQARVTLVFDPGGVESSRFGATASGCCVLYDQAGRLAFSGGVTAGRGHAGPSRSQQLLAERLSGVVDGYGSLPSLRVFSHTERGRSMIAIAQTVGPASEAKTADADFHDQLRRVHTNADRLFGCLMVVQFFACAAAAWWLTSYTWSGDSPAIHPHVWSVMTVGAAATLLPALLCWRRPGEAATRYAIAVAQMIVGALLIHISGGRIEMHFHVFGSLAFLAAYRDWRVIVIASLVVAVDHVARGLYWPTSVFGIDEPAVWRAMEHAGWVAFEDVILMLTTAQSIREMRKMSVTNARMQGLIAQQERHAFEVERLNADLERHVEERTEELAAERELLDSMIRGLPNAVFWKDTAGVYLGCNEAFARFVGAEDSAAVIGRTDDDLAWDADTRAKKVERENRVLTTRQPLVDAEVTKVLDDGTAREVIASKTVLTDSCGDVRGVVSIYTEVTELNRLRTRLQESDKLQAVGRLAAGIAHEINTPIQTAAANLEFLRAGIEQLLDLAESCHSDVGESGDPARRATIEPSSFERLKLHAPGAINDSAQAIERVTEIVRAMRIMSHPGKEQKVETDINTLARSAATITRSRWKEVAEVDFDLDAGLPQVECHAGVISQVLLNLIVNASDAIADSRESQDPLGRITLGTRADDHGVVVEVTDTGPGVPEAIRDRLFEPFFTTKEVGSGTGQGLAIAYDAIVNKHGGRLECDSAPGAGATFRVWLPQFAAPVVAGRIGGQTA